MNNMTFKKEKKQTSIFITAGFPKVDSLQEQILFLQAKGIDFIEVGIPFSDPMADGEKIQETSNCAIANGMTVTLMFEQLKSFKDEVKIPLVIMTYFNPILNFGLDLFLKKCCEVGIFNVIIPDISLECYERNYKNQFEKSGINLCFLVTPNSNNERIKKMASYSKNGFLYLVSQNAITGENKESSDKLTERYSEIKTLCAETPMMIGFGIKNREDLQRAQHYSDGGIIGTAYLNALSDAREEEFIDGLFRE
jgi:tryptophan synthase alpha chain